MIAVENKLTNLQLELLKMFKYDLKDNQLLELKALLSQYFMNKIDSELDKIWDNNNWDNNNWDNNKIENIANQHTRTPYNK